MATCFVYGTLMDERVLARVILHVPSLESTNVYYEAGELPGFKRYSLKNRDYPGIMPALSDDRVQGKLVFNLDAGALARLDYFESDEYRREAVTVVATDGRSYVADVYVWKDAREIIDNAHDWDFAQFQRTNVSKWVAEELDEAEGLGGRFWKNTADRIPGEAS